MKLTTYGDSRGDISMAAEVFEGFWSPFSSDTSEILRDRARTRQTRNNYGHTFAECPGKF
jgi:hypothetical protein